MHTPSKAAIDSLLGRYGRDCGAVPLAAAFGLRDALEGLGLFEPGWS